MSHRTFSSTHCCIMGGGAKVGIGPDAGFFVLLLRTPLAVQATVQYRILLSQQAFVLRISTQHFQATHPYLCTHRGHNIPSLLSSTIRNFQP